MSPSVTVRVDLSRVRDNARQVRSRCGVDVLAVLKADAYRLGAADVARVLSDVVQGFYFYSLDEVHAVRRAVDFDVPALVLRGDLHDAKDFLDARATPVVWDVAHARRLRDARPVVSIDTGQQRFGCDEGTLSDVLRAGHITEAMTHATRPEQVTRFEALTRGLRRHAAGSNLLDVRNAWLDAVRPGLALFHDAMTITTHLIDVRTAQGPTGYSGFVSSTGRHGILPVGYTDGLRPGPCLVNGVRQLIREVGMQSAFVESSPTDRSGDPVTLLGTGLSVHDIASHWQTSAQEVLVSLARMKQR
jgi:alanine racemase